jgi:hypothetical protein
MTYNIIKWLVFIMIIATSVSFFFQDGVKLFWEISIFLFIAPRLENSMDMVYCGQEMACHKIQKWDIAALIFITLEIISDFSTY